MRVNPFVLMFFVMSLSPKVGLCAAPEETPATEVKDSAGEEKIAWGKETNGLVANLRALTTDVKPGDPMEFEIRVKNVSKEEISLLGSGGKRSPFPWSFYFGEWEWTPPYLSRMALRLKPGETASVRCLVATTRDSLTAEQERRVYASAFRNVKNNAKKSVRLPDGSYRVRAATYDFRGGDPNTLLVETNTIEVRIIEGSDIVSDVDVTAAQKLLRTFRESRESGDLNPDLLMEQAKKVGEQFRKAYPYKSLRNRLEDETKNRPGLNEPKLSPEAAKRLDRNDTRFALQSAPGTFGNFRAKSLERLHSEQVAQFIAREGFGRSRMPAPPNPGYWELPPAPTIPFAAAPKLSTDQEADDAQSLPKQVTRYDMLRLHAGEPTWTNEQVKNKYYNHLSHDEKMKAMFETYSAWKAKHNPLNLPSRNLIFDSHDAAVLNFAGSGRNGHAKDVDQVAGFGSHAMTKTPQFEPGPIELRYWPDSSKEAPIQWLVTQLQLVSLLKHDVPGVYVSKNLPKMEELEGADLRPLNDFEAANLERLFDGEHMAMDVRANRIRMHGALRASKQCIQCHQVNRGELLGAFSYDLVRAKLNEPSTGHDSLAN